MRHTTTSIQTHMKHVAGLHGAAAKKAALFGILHTMTGELAADCKALGATDAQVVPIHDLQKLLMGMRAQIEAVDLS